MVLFRITENEPSKMHNVRPYVYSKPWVQVMSNDVRKFFYTNIRRFKALAGVLIFLYSFLKS